VSPGVGPAGRSQRRKVAVASWRAPRDGRIHTRLEIEAGPLVGYAAALSARHGVPVSPVHVVGRAVAAGLRQEPAFNARVVFGRLVPLPRVDVSFAVDIGGGHDLAPVTLRGADALTTAGIAEALAGRADRVRAGADPQFRRSNRWVRVAPWFLTRPALAVASLWSGGLGHDTFGLPGFPFGSAFVSNVGTFGIDEALLAPLPLARCPLYVCLGAIRDRPVAVDGAVVARPTLVLTATADHRIVDGAHAGRLARFLRSALADPASLDDPPGDPAEGR
jgi:hypothetical protein